MVRLGPRAVLPARAVAVDVLPQSLEPELATLIGTPPVGEWLYEIKFDGYRMLVRVEGRDIKITTRRGNDWTSRFPRLKREFAAAKLPPGWYDGEIVMLDAQGKPDFNALQKAIEGGDNDRIVMFLFDAPYLLGHDIRAVPVEDRRAALQAVLRESELLRFSRELERVDAANLLASACQLGLEGVIGKRRGSKYVHRRSDDWVKLKCVRRQEFVIGGYTWPDQSRADAGIGALLVGYFDDDGALQYAGKVGTGFGGETSADLRRRLDSMAVRKRPFSGATGHDTHAQWAEPRLLCEVAFNEWPEGGSLRHASFKGLREDKQPTEARREEPVLFPTKSRPPTIEPAASAIRITHGARVIDPQGGFTKLDLAAYYAQVAKWMLPHLAGRHTYAVRFPTGIEGERIFQQHPLGMRGLKGTDPALWPGHDPALRIESTDDLVRAVQLDIIEFHTWNSKAAAIHLPDRMVFDLDPGEDVPWEQVIEGAQLVRVMLQEIGLKSWVKTTGGKGLHLFVPLAPEFDYPTVKAFSGAVVAHLSKTIPQRFVSKSGARNRMGRIFIDFLRNGQSQSTAEAYSARARPGLGVSMPVAWEQLNGVAGPAHWTIGNALNHLRARRTDPWAAYAKTRQGLGQAMKALGFTTAG